MKCDVCGNKISVRSHDYPNQEHNHIPPQKISRNTSTKKSLMDNKKFITIILIATGLMILVANVAIPLYLEGPENYGDLGLRNIVHPNEDTNQTAEVRPPKKQLSLIF